MIDPQIIKTKLGLDDAVRHHKVWVAQREIESYNKWYNDPENEKDRRMAKEKVIDILKVNDEEWQAMEAMLTQKELELRRANLVLEVLQNTLRALSNPESGVNFEMFEELQETYVLEFSL